MRVYTIERKAISPYEIRFTEKVSEHIQSVVKIIESNEVNVHPVVVDIEACLISGIYLYHAFRQLQIDYIPACIGFHLTPYQISAYRTADKNAKSYWDDQQIFDLINDEYKSPATESGLGLKEMDFLRKVLNAQDKKNKSWRRNR